VAARQVADTWLLGLGDSQARHGYGVRLPPFVAKPKEAPVVWPGPEVA
jgi:hypothetical protein